MANNRFNGLLNGREKEEFEIYGLYSAELNDLFVRGELSESGAGSDVGFNEDYSSTATYASYLATANMAVYRLVLNIFLGSVDETVAQDTSLWLGGNTALTNGITFGTSTSATAASYLISFPVVKYIHGFTEEWGAEVYRNLVIESATDAANQDSVTVILDFKKIFGCPIRLRKDDYIGVHLNDDFSSVTTTFTGSIYGREIQGED